MNMYNIQKILTQSFYIICKGKIDERKFNFCFHYMKSLQFLIMPSNNISNSDTNTCNTFNTAVNGKHFNTVYFHIHCVMQSNCLITCVTQNMSASSKDTIFTCAQKLAAKPA